jgi:hypothetical protein
MISAAAIPVSSALWWCLSFPRLLSSHNIQLWFWGQYTPAPKKFLALPMQLPSVYAHNFQLGHFLELKLLIVPWLEVDVFIQFSDDVLVVQPMWQQVSVQMIYDFRCNTTTKQLASFVSGLMDLLLTGEDQSTGQSAKQSGWRSPHVNLNLDLASSQVE